MSGNDNKVSARFNCELFVKCKSCFRTLNVISEYSGYKCMIFYGGAEPFKGLQLKCTKCLSLIIIDEILF